MDLSMPFRLSNVSNNAVLDLVLRAAASDAGASSVRVQFVSNTGEKAQGSFSPATPFGDILLSFCRDGQLQASEAVLSDSAFAGVVVVYMRTQIMGADVAKTTLGSLGIVDGAVAFRVTIPATASTRPVAPPAPAPAPAAAAAAASETAAAAAEAPAVDGSAAAAAVMEDAAADTDTVSSSANGGAVESKGMEADDAPPAAAPTPSASTTAAAAVAPASGPSSAAMEDAAPATASAVAASAAPAAAPSSAAASGEDAQKTRIRAAGAQVRAGLQALRAAVFDADARESCLMMIRVLDNLITRPADPKVRTMRLSNPKVADTIGRHAGALQVLAAAGWKQESAGGGGGEAQLVLHPGDENDEITLGVRNMVALEASAMGARVPPPPDVDEMARAAMVLAGQQAKQLFDPFKPMLLRMDSDSRTGGVKPEVKLLASPPSPARGGAGGGAGAGASASAAASLQPTSVASPGKVVASALSTAIAASGDSRALTAMEQKVVALKAKAAALMEAGGPLERKPRVILYNPQARFQANKFTAEELASLESAGRASGGAGAGAGAGAASHDSMPVRGGNGKSDDDEPSPEELRMLLQYTAKRMKQEKEDKEKVSLARVPDRITLACAHVISCCYAYCCLQGFKTKAMRDMEQLQKAKVYTSTLLRVQLPDRTVLQAHFSPLEPVSALHEWARSCIKPRESDGSRIPFYLMTTPPPTVVPEQEDRTLAEAGLQPAALVYLVWGEAPDRKTPTEACPTDPATYLTPEMYATSSDNAAAAAAEAFPASATLVEQPKPEVDAAAAALLAGQGAPVRAGSGAGGGSGKGAPAWLKLGAK